MRIHTLIPVAAMAVISVAATAPDARACGGCFHEPLPPTQSGTVVTDHRMIFSVSPSQTSLYDEVQYAGSPSSFAWVLPIHAPVTVGLSSDVVFAALEQATQTVVVSPPLPPCPSSNCFCGGFGASNGSSSGGGGLSSGSPPPVTVISQQTVGPYDTVQLQSTDPSALNAWLTANGYVIPPDVQPIIAAYVSEAFDFLALKLAPGQGIQAMRPVRVTSPGAGLSLPLRMVAAGTGPIVGITLWVVADGRYEPANAQFFTITASDLVWDWSVSRSTYTTVRTQKEAESNNWAWQIESSLAISPYQIENPVLNSYANDYTPIPSSDAGAGAGDAGAGGGGKTASEVRQDDLAALFPGGAGSVRITRMRADLAHAALNNDLVLQASADQSTLSNIYQVTESVNAPVCPPVSQCPCSGGSSGSSGSGVAGSSSGTGETDGGTGDGGASAGGPSHHGCAASAAEPGHGALGFVASGLLGLVLVRARRRNT